jgi:4-hydroxy 2-oxovalerate aldolase
MVTPDQLAEQAKIQEAAGATAVYCTDSAGALTPRSAAERVGALRRALAPSTRVGFHAHNNLGLAVGNTIAAIEHGAALIDAATRGVGAGAGNCATEAIAAAADKLGIDLGISVPAIADVAEEIVSEAVPTRPALDRASLMLGWAGVYSSFLLHAEAAARRYDVATAEILVELGRLGVVGGQEDMIIDVAIRLAERGDRAPARR